MSTRDSILSSIKKVKSDPKPLPELPDFGVNGSLTEVFIQSILGNKGEVMEKAEFEAWLQVQAFPKVLSIAQEYRATSNIVLPEDPHDLEDLNLAILNGQFGVAENGAIWLDDSQLPHRAIPFIAEHLVILLQSHTLVPTLHQAYVRIGEQHSGFGLFVAGPSKTADIEQSLVIGAHGAKSLRVVFI